MSEEKTIQSELTGYMATLLREHFGKGPTSVYVTIKRPYIVIHFRGFISPTEKILLKQNEWKLILETRDLLLNEMKPRILEELLKITELKFTELYADWNLSLQTGLFLGIMDEKTAAEDLKWPKELDREAFHQRIERANEEVQRKPGSIESVWLNERTVLVKRSEILVGIEKALLAEGYTEVLKLVKRPLERKLLGQAQLEEILQRAIVETFMDWNFDQDVGYVVFIVEPHPSNRK